jgi:hypothetical protein
MLTFSKIVITGLALCQIGQGAQTDNNQDCHGEPGCTTSEPYLDSTLPPFRRADDLLGRMTWEEKVGQLGGIRRAFGTSNGKPVFNRTVYETTRSTQNGQIGE